MKTRSEAEHLQKRIETYFSIIEPDREKCAKEIINQVLDAVIESMLEYSGRDSKMTYLELVNKLRP